MRNGERCRSSLGPSQPRFADCPVAQHAISRHGWVRWEMRGRWAAYTVDMMNSTAARIPLACIVKAAVAAMIDQQDSRGRFACHRHHQLIDRCGN
eukprot:6184445-Pleurochrysis_carterae.AAC.1